MEVEGVLAFFFSVVLVLPGDCLLADVVVVVVVVAMRVGFVGVLILFFGVGVMSELASITVVEEEAEEAPVVVAVVVVAVAPELDKCKENDRKDRLVCKYAMLQ